MILNAFILSAVIVAPGPVKPAAEENPVPVIIDTLQESHVTALKEALPLSRTAVSAMTLRHEVLNQTGTYRPQALSAQMPGLYIPDYGASLTSTIYLRGLGSRMENPVMGLYIDGIPILDKNTYDMDWEALRSATLLRGPQGTLYGRNAMGGVLALSSLSPFDYARPVVSLEAGVAPAATKPGLILRASAHYTTGTNVFSLTYRHSDGFFYNAYKETNCDPYDGLSARWKWEKPASENLFLSNVLMLGLNQEGGFAYGQVIDGKRQDPAYNDEAGYKRLSVIDGFRVRYRSDKYTLDATTSLQILSDDMHMDQDYTPVSIFTLEQRQNSAALTAEAILRNTVSDIWHPSTGIFSFYKFNNLWAPVTFKRDGIETLMLDNANKNIPKDIGYLEISDNTMPVNSDFLIGTWNVALFHESVFELGKWILTAGLRLDYEGARMDYDCLAQLHYRFVPTMQANKPLDVPYKGAINHGKVVLLPKVSALYEATDHFNLFATVSKGYRAGGFNTQIFSDILQNNTMTALMKDLGVYLDRPTVSVNAGFAEYSPEEAWNFEAGLRYQKGEFKASASLYALTVKNQQLTAFPPGKNTGRMMVNAARSRSLGAEAELSWTPGSWNLSTAYSFCDSRFLSYNDGNETYDGNRVPYVPAHTLHVNAGYNWSLSSSTTLKLNTSLCGAGPFAWNEADSLEESFSLRWNARVALTIKDRVEISLRGENLLNTRNDVFYFKSMGNEFLAAGKPLTLMAGITYYLTNI